MVATYGCKALSKAVSHEYVKSNAVYKRFYLFPHTRMKPLCRKKPPNFPYLSVENQFDMSETRVMPIGAQNFQALRENRFVYVDKTRYVYQLISQSRVFFLCPPPPFW